MSLNICRSEISCDVSSSDLNKADQLLRTGDTEFDKILLEFDLDTQRTAVDSFSG